MVWGWPTSTGKPVTGKAARPRPVGRCSPGGCLRRQAVVRSDGFAQPVVIRGQDVGPPQGEKQDHFPRPRPYARQPRELRPGGLVGQLPPGDAFSLLQPPGGQRAQTLVLTRGNLSVQHRFPGQGQQMPRMRVAPRKRVQQPPEPTAFAAVVNLLVNQATHQVVVHVLRGVAGGKGR